MTFPLLPKLPLLLAVILLLLAGFALGVSGALLSLKRRVRSRDEKDAAEGEYVAFAAIEKGDLERALRWLRKIRRRPAPLGHTPERPHPALAHIPRRARK